MINYMRSEKFLLLRKVSFYIIALVAVLIPLLYLMILNQFKNVEGFPYGNARHIYGFIIYSPYLESFIGLLIVALLTENKNNYLKNTISFGTKRNSIYFGKLAIGLIFFVVLCLVSIFCVSTLTQVTLPTSDTLFRNYLISIINVVPLVISMVVFGYALLINAGNPTLVLILIGFLPSIIKIANKFISALDINLSIFSYFPSTLYAENFARFYDGSSYLMIVPWIVGIIISVVSYLVGMRSFNKKDI
ncbi:hypothetical protein BG261_03060 [Floricoccus tropicus]|uniref:Uncharacterized protein n=1 Tax=Floricoccus tropicus TaxID=1859473 RepID=A0A1E8GMV7_9LACT|nr:hypothetical protein [Floricoccus tropicus]OFI49575.1 hypothetical protein BG261_03060 [Floricoccus tropicus]